MPRAEAEVFDFLVVVTNCSPYRTDFRRFSSWFFPSVAAKEVVNRPLDRRSKRLLRIRMDVRSPIDVHTARLTCREAVIIVGAGYKTTAISRSPQGLRHFKF